ncbi:hypothetical protein [Anaerocolumna sp. MB42-C2]|uniref:hypothetical protein n=1 Tax=Anaerocolumna sp. MB42-C2 TaxID=3070997 RepID=UPI0027E0B1D6|nr:hypothetical protein [Anaerocolumna sp. MB42-C2]WMJ87901.1 hypothetical protein RBU59_28405 [Anaerocolumna sp. MB42-C2]
MVKVSTVFFIYQLISTGIILVDELIGNDSISTDFYGTLFGYIFASKGGFTFVVLGVVLYYTKNNRKKLAIGYCCFCIFYTIFYVTNIVARLLIKFESILPYFMYYTIACFAQIMDMEIIPVYHTRFLH